MNLTALPIVIIASLVLASCASTPRGTEADPPSQLSEYTNKHLKMYETRPEVQLASSDCANSKLLNCMSIDQGQCLLITKVARYKCAEKVIAKFGNEPDIEDPFIDGYYKGCYASSFYLQSPVGIKTAMDCMK